MFVEASALRGRGGFGWRVWAGLREDEMVSGRMSCLSRRWGEREWKLRGGLILYQAYGNLYAMTRDTTPGKHEDLTSEVDDEVGNNELEEEEEDDLDYFNTFPSMKELEYHE
ncbi:hypothetical protein Tco_0517664, partial [Tanacetum coccineum]